MLGVVVFSDGIDEQINEVFSPPLIEGARQILRPEQGDRVLRAVLVLSEGDLGRLQHFSDAADIDSRDVLMWAETPTQPDEPTSYEELRARLHLPPEP